MSATTMAIGRPWTPDEDNQLRLAVATHGEIDNWKTVALSVPGRTNKACRKRWLHSLSPTVRKSAWTEAEDRQLLDLYAVYSTKWSVIARHIPGRTDDACSKRYREALDPSLKKNDWTREEDDKLLEAYARSGGKWGQIGQELSRSGLGCRNRWRLLGRKNLTVDSTRPPPNPLSSTSLRHISPPVDWSNLSMLDVTRFWDTDRSNLYGPDRSTLSFGHNPSYVRTQEDLAGEHLAASSANSFWDDNDMSFAQSHPPTTPDFSGMQARHAPSVQCQRPTMPPLDFEHDLNLQGGLFNALPPSSLVDRRTVAEDTEEHGGAYSPLETSNAVIPENANSNTDLRTPAGPLENSTPYRGVSSAMSPPSDNHFQSTRDICDSRASSNSLPIIHTDNAPELPVSESTSPLHSPVSEFSTPSHNFGRSSPYYRSPLQRPARKTNKDTQALLTFNSDLTATADPSVKPYACGHRLCWPARETKSCACFATSRELNDHSKTLHADDILGGGKPFRCGLDRCAKSWKSINGLQYHLQVSRAHFQRALSLLEVASPAIQNIDEPTVSTNPATSKQKLHHCPKPGCNKQYKQLSGLRYHLTHGHLEPEDIPAQLDVVPPALARRVARQKSGAAS